jgi:hypothetical protein
MTRMLQFRISPQDEFMLAHGSGLVSVDAWRTALQELQAALRPIQRDRLVVDLTALLGWLGVPERKAVGALWATHLAQMKKVALVIQAHKITGVVETEAQRNGLDLRLFAGYEEAVKWAVS